MTQIRIASQPGGQSENEDWAGATPHAAVVLDGLTSPSELDSGCVHGVPWFVHQLGSSLLKRLANVEESLRGNLAAAISDVAQLHAGQCDLANTGTPSATVALVRVREQEIEWLVLADAAVLLETDDGIRVVTDDRVSSVAAAQRDAALAEGHSDNEKRRLISELVSAQRKVRNQAGGYWIAGSNPDAAYEASTGSVGRRDGQRCALLTDGVTRLVEFGESSWMDLFEALDKEGPERIIGRVREAEASDPELARWPRYKPSDDATAVVLNL